MLVTEGRVAEDQAARCAVQSAHACAGGDKGRLLEACSAFSSHVLCSFIGATVMADANDRLDIRRRGHRGSERLPGLLPESGVPGLPEPVWGPATWPLSRRPLSKCWRSCTPGGEIRCSGNSQRTRNVDGEPLGLWIIRQPPPTV